MALRINTNVGALQALRNLSVSDRAQRQSLLRLSTGLRINTASDDPSGLVISEQLRAQVRSLRQAIDNSQTASNILGTAEAALTEVSNLLSQIRESLVFALNSNSTEQQADRCIKQHKKRMHDETKRTDLRIIRKQHRPQQQCPGVEWQR